jgi:RNA polymerase sigma-70 factor (ECF subfamily)
MSAAAAFRHEPDDVDQLIDRCLGGDRAAWGTLYQGHRPRAVAFLRRLGVPSREAEDAWQEVFLQVFRYLARFERRADFRTWLYKLCISQAARWRRRAVLSRPLSWLGMAEPITQPEWSTSRAVELVDRALGRMSARHRAAFVLFELEGVPVAGVAQVLGIPEPSARRNIHEARTAFQAFVREQPFADRSDRSQKSEKQQP